MKQTLIHTSPRRSKSNVINYHLLAQAFIMVETAFILRNRLKMYAAGPEATKALKREAAQAEDDARELIRGAYGYPAK